jgi:hypothetical protein
MRTGAAVRLAACGAALAVAGVGCSSSSAGAGAGTPAADAGEAIPTIALSTPPTQPVVGCATTRPAVVHHGGAKVIQPQPAAAPIPCAGSTGAASFDPTLVITTAGKVLFAPANVPGLTTSSDQGKTWSSPVNPPGATAATGANLLHPWLWQDTVSHRIFFNLYSTSAGTCADGSGATLWTSDDEGATWTSGPVGCGSRDWGKVITGPAATAASKAALAQSGYPDMVYYCATGPMPITGPDHICYRSEDGGKTFTETATHPVAGPSGGYPTGGAVGPDGVLYVPRGSAGGLDIAASSDEGDTFVPHVIAGSHFVGTSSRNWLSMNVAADAAGNVYAVWSGDGDLLPYIASSRDHGKTWSAPVMIGAPGVKTTAYPSITVKAPGYVAVAYYGSTGARGSSDGYIVSDGLPYSAYVVVTTDAFAASPVFWSATFNDPKTPLFTGLAFSISEYMGYPVFASDGSIWVGFLDNGQGMAGRLTFPTSG